MNNLTYQIAGHKLRLSFPTGTFAADDLSNYAPFGVAEGASECLFHLSVVDELLSLAQTSSLCAVQAYELVGQFDDDIASIGVMKSRGGDFRFRIAYPHSADCCTMDAVASFSKAQVVLPHNEQLHLFCLNNCLMLLYAFATASFDTLLMHASVITNNDEGFIFLGKSGTGKSTHSRLWLDHIAGSELLNDDNPVMRIIDGKAYVYGTPWSGKTPCYKNKSTPLKGIVKLRQAPKNEIKKLSSLVAYATVSPACSCMRWEEAMMDGVHRTVEQLVSHVDCYQLDCLPDEAAAKLCYTTHQQTIK